MTCNLIRLRCEKRYGLPDGKEHDWPGPDHRWIDVPPGIANQIKAWYEAQGWEVMQESIRGLVRVVRGLVDHAANHFCVQLAYRRGLLA